MELLETLQAKVGFTSTEMKIADYILEHRYQAVDMSANALARETFSSTASVIRMCRKMGLSGYRKFQVALAAGLSKEEERERRVNSRGPAFADMDPENVMQRFLDTIVRAAESCRKRVLWESLTRAAVWIAHVNRLYIYGADCFNALALCRMMSEFGISAVIPEGLSENMSGYEDVSEGAVALFVAYSGDALQGLRKKMAALRKRGCRVIALSTESVCPDADIVISFPEPETDCLRVKTAYLQAAFLYITSCINDIIAAARRKET